MSKCKVSMKKFILIITSDSLKEAFTAFINKKQELGFAVTCITVESINKMISGESATPVQIATKIKCYIHTRFNYNELFYVILGGGYKEVPALDAERHSSRYVDRTGVPRTVEVFSPSDYKYTLDVDNNMKFVIGRFPVGESQDMANLCRLYVNYAPQRNDKILIVSDDDDTASFVAELQTILRGKQVTCLKKEGKLEDITTLTREILNHSFILYTGHGNPLYWNYGQLGTTDDGSQFFTESKISPMPRHPHICCWACATSCFSIKTDCIGVSFMKKGAMTYWGASYETRQSVNRLMAKKMLEVVLRNPTISVGEAYYQVLQCPKVRQQEKESYLLFGDPTLPFFSV
ncbi:hypothetical protein F2841_20560 [Bacteroides fragilis]|jgi:hypothetical protein|nr:hypothetical protein F2841_20560 [Bacteroides fragilis]KAA4773905.1 hypothetical protein F3B22_19015 [Bacteroides fragilis]KAA4784794.1 hypothetical protein F3B21_20355 [Bacteroides fragilis]KAA4787652.1 hypothetical protein F2047_19295 [Bacteroides fragilis]